MYELKLFTDAVILCKDNFVLKKWLLKDLRDKNNVDAVKLNKTLRDFIETLDTLKTLQIDYKITITSFNFDF